MAGDEPPAFQSLQTLGERFPFEMEFINVLAIQVSEMKIIPIRQGPLGWIDALDQHRVISEVFERHPAFDQIICFVDPVVQADSQQIDRVSQANDRLGIWNRVYLLIYIDQHQIRTSSIKVTFRHGCRHSSSHRKLDIHVG